MEFSFLELTATMVGGPDSEEQKVVKEGGRTRFASLRRKGGRGLFQIERACVEMSLVHMGCFHARSGSFFPPMH